MKTIVQYDKDGCVYVYHEDEKHFRSVEEQRSYLTLRDDLDENCKLEPGEYVIIDNASL